MHNNTRPCILTLYIIGCTHACTHMHADRVVSEHTFSRFACTLMNTHARIHTHNANLRTSVRVSLFFAHRSDGVRIAATPPVMSRYVSVREVTEGNSDVDFTQTETSLTIAWDGVFRYGNSIVSALNGIIPH